MKNDQLLGIGIAGSVIAAVCCFTPLLVIALTSIGLAAWASSGWLDFVLLGSLCLFLLVTAYAVIRRIRANDRSSD
jgi:mercuric ion transport protein